LDKVRYNKFLREQKMTSKQAKQQIDSLMLQLQDVLEQVGLDEHEPIQNAFNALAMELDDAVF
jgi:hypothetical protein